MRKDGAVDIKMFSACKERFEEHYAMTQEARQELRKHDAYRQALLDLYEMGCQASGMAENSQEFFYLLGQAAYGLMNEKVRITGNQE